MPGKFQSDRSIDSQTETDRLTERQLEGRIAGYGLMGMEEKCSECRLMR